MLLHRLADAAFWTALVVAALAPFGAARAGAFALAAVVWELLSRRPLWFDPGAMDWARLGALAGRQIVVVVALFYLFGSGMIGTVAMLPGLQGTPVAGVLVAAAGVPYWVCLGVSLAALAALWRLSEPAR